jgi:hypothetical protein
VTRLKKERGKGMGKKKRFPSPIAEKVLVLLAKLGSKTESPIHGRTQ